MSTDPSMVHTLFYNDAQVEPHQQFKYDALYRLIEANGREHSGGVGDDQRDQNDLPLWNLPHPNNTAALRRYIEEYTYDKVGNILAFYHEGVNGPGSATWTRTYRYDTGLTSGYTNNRLHSTSVPGPAWANYTHDANGNMVSMPHLATIEYTHRDQMRHADLGGGGDAYYTYDAGGERVRKFIQRTGTTTEERIYLGGWELYRKRVGTAHDIEVERETLHVMDDTRRIAMVETLTVEDEDPVSPVAPRIRYQYGNHLGSAMLECDEAGDVISYEEYHPYGTAAYRSAKSGVEVSEKRYRYTGKERDEETGFSYHQWRYYAPWLARWTSTDPKGLVDGPTLYTYVRGNPVRLQDPSGRSGLGTMYVLPDNPKDPAPPQPASDASAADWEAWDKAYNEWLRRNHGNGTPGGDPNIETQKPTEHEDRSGPGSEPAAHAPEAPVSHGSPPPGSATASDSDAQAQPESGFMEGLRGFSQGFLEGAGIPFTRPAKTAFARHWQAGGRIVVGMLQVATGGAMAGGSGLFGAVTSPSGAGLAVGIAGVAAGITIASVGFANVINTTVLENLAHLTEACDGRA